MAKTLNVEKIETCEMDFSFYIIYRLEQTIVAPAGYLEVCDMVCVMM